MRIEQAFQYIKRLQGMAARPVKCEHPFYFVYTVKSGFVRYYRSGGIGRKYYRSNFSYINPTEILNEWEVVKRHDAEIHFI